MAARVAGVACTPGAQCSLSPPLLHTSLVPQLKYGSYGIRALSARRVAANTIEAVRR
jgi:hypothetical protein